MCRGCSSLSTYLFCSFESSVLPDKFNPLPGKQTNGQAAPPEDASKTGGPGSAKNAERESSSCQIGGADNQQNGTGGSSSTSGARHQRREETRRRRHDRRATPYGTAGGVGGWRRRGEDPSSESAARRQRTGPTTGEAQVKQDHQENGRIAVLTFLGTLYSLIRC